MDSLSYSLLLLLSLSSPTKIATTSFLYLLPLPSSSLSTVHLRPLAPSSMAGERHKLTSHQAHCFSFHLVAYDDRAPPQDARVGLLTFKVEKLSKGTRDQSCEDAVKNAEDDTLPSLIPHAAELAFDPDDPNVTLVTWAGMLPRSERVKQLLGRQVKKGTSVATLDGNIPLVRHDPTAMRVVCFVKGATAIYYALTKQDPTTHLCTGFMIERETVSTSPNSGMTALPPLPNERATGPPRYELAVPTRQRRSGPIRRTTRSSSSSAASVRLRWRSNPSCL